MYPIPFCCSLADMSKAKELLGWEHKTDIKKKIQEMIVL